jgi:hypothetical protein
VPVISHVVRLRLPRPISGVTSAAANGSNRIAVEIKPYGIVAKIRIGGPAPHDRTVMASGLRVYTAGAAISADARIREQVSRTA